MTMWTAIAIAVLKYRLYDIDRLISRTLAYAIVTGLLIGVYAGLVLLATQVLTLKSPVAVADAGTASGFQERPWFTTCHSCYLPFRRIGMARQARSSRVYPAPRLLLLFGPGPAAGNVCSGREETLRSRKLC